MIVLCSRGSAKRLAGEHIILGAVWLLVGLFCQVSFFPLWW